MSRLARFLRELKRRKVYRAATLYAIAALGTVEAADLILPRLGFAESAVTFILVIALLAFPLVIVLAWAYEATPEGIVRAEAAGSSPPGDGRTPWIAAIGALAVIGGAAWWLLDARSAGEAGIESARSGGDAVTGPATMGRSSVVAVLPFRDLSAEGDQAWFGQGLAEEILGGLSRIPGLRVVASQSSFALAEAPISEVGELLGTTHVLSGSTRIEGDRAVIRAQLTTVEREAEVWSRSFRPELSSVLDVQEEIARAVVGAMEVELGPVGSGRIMAASTSDPGAHEHYLRGLQLWNRRSESDLLTAIEHFRSAVERDPDYAAAWAGLAYAYLVLPEYSPSADVRRMRELSVAAASRALEIDPRQPDALTAMGWARMIHEYDWDEAERLISAALAFDSTSVRALHWQSHVVSWQGRHDEAVSLARKAVELDPLSAIMRQNLAFILMEARAYEEALRELERVLAPQPNFAISRRTVWNIHARTGRYEAAAEALVSWLTGIGRDAAAAAELADRFRIAAERFHEAGMPGTLPRELIGRLRPGIEMAGQLYAAVGDRETTLAYLEQAYRERAGSRNLLSVKINPLYDFLREEPRFRDLLGRIGLEEQAG